MRLRALPYGASLILPAFDERQPRLGCSPRVPDRETSPSWKAGRIKNPRAMDFGAVADPVERIV